MARKEKISDCRKTLEKTLASQSLADKEAIRNHVQNRLHSSPAEVQEKRVAEVLNFLETLRSASGLDFKASKNYGSSQGGWKVQQDNEDYRIMYREGPQGSPFQTLLTESFVDAPIDICLCTGWEVSLYTKWWPQIRFPSFKVTTACCLKEIGINEHISLIRMTVPWPVSDRELVIDYFEMEYLEDGLVIVLLNSVADTDSVEEHMAEFTDGEIPKAKAVRMDLRGGFVLKKINSNLSLTRMVVYLDVKLDFIPPPLVNFISRRLLVDGCNLYKKIVASVARGDKDYEKALEGSLYVRIREHLYTNKKLENAPGPKALQ